MKRKIRNLIPLWLFLGGCVAALANPITPAGEKLSAFLDGMDVEHHWLAHQPINWRTGGFDDHPASSAQASHCSAFAAAACERAGVYLLRPPEHRQTLLSNAQYRWLAESGPAYGWQRLAGGQEAQDAANNGLLVLATVANPDPHKPGHVAIVRPADRTPAQITEHGPEVIQAGQKNWNRISARGGFANHKPAFEDGLIIYYAHPIHL